jgi:glycosyltransferase involved in cell wall biosynthesis
MALILGHLAGDFHFTLYGTRIEDKLKQKVPFRKLPIPVMRPRIITYLVQYVAYGILFWILRFRREFDLIHQVECVSPWADVITMHYCGAKVKELRRSNVIQSGNFTRRLYKAILYALGTRMERISLSSRYLKAIISVSEGLRKDITRYYGPKVDHIVIPNPIELSRFESAKQHREEVRTSLGIHSGDSLVGVTCALGDWERKGLAELAHAYATLADRRLRLIVVGPGAQEFCVRRGLVEGIRDKFFFVGPTDEVEKYYGAADFFILPSAFEGWPIVALEAAAAGLPVVGTRVNGLDQFIEEGVNGFFIDRDIHSLVSKLKHIVEVKDELPRMGSNAMLKATQFSVEYIAQRHRNVYMVLTSNRKNLSVEA